MFLIIGRVFVFPCYERAYVALAVTSVDFNQDVKTGRLVPFLNPDSAGLIVEPFDMDCSEKFDILNKKH